MSYYDVDAILADAQKLPCTFETTVPGLGYLDGNAGADMTAGSRVELPLWLAEMLAVPSRHGANPVVSLDLPKALSEPVMNALKADPRFVDVRGQAPHFYRLAVRILALLEDDEIDDVLVESLKKRAVDIFNHAHNPRGALGEGVEFLRGLDETERKLFRAAHDSSKDVRAWAGQVQKSA